MLYTTDEGMQRAEQLARRSHIDLDKEDLAFLAAVDIIETYPMQDAYDLANRVPFLSGDAWYRTKVVKGWIEEGLLEKGKG